MINRRNLVLAAPAIVDGSGLLLSTLGARAAATPSVIRFGQSASLTGGQGR
jgi:hypothetical protein